MSELYTINWEPFSDKTVVPQEIKQTLIKISENWKTAMLKKLQSSFALKRLIPTPLSSFRDIVKQKLPIILGTCNFSFLKSNFQLVIIKGQPASGKTFIMDMLSCFYEVNNDKNQKEGLDQFFQNDKRLINLAQNQMYSAVTIKMDFRMFQLQSFQFVIKSIGNQIVQVLKRNQYLFSVNELQKINHQIAQNQQNQNFQSLLELYKLIFNSLKTKKFQVMCFFENFDDLLLMFFKCYKMDRFLQVKDFLIQILKFSRNATRIFITTTVDFFYKFRCTYFQTKNLVSHLQLEQYLKNVLDCGNSNIEQIVQQMGFNFGGYMQEGIENKSYQTFFNLGNVIEYLNMKRSEDKEVVKTLAIHDVQYRAILEIVQKQLQVQFRQVIQQIQQVLSSTKQKHFYVYGKIKKEKLIILQEIEKIDRIQDPIEKSTIMRNLIISFLVNLGILTSIQDSKFAKSIVFVPNLYAFNLLNQIKNKTYIKILKLKNSYFDISNGKITTQQIRETFNALYSRDSGFNQESFRNAFASRYHNIGKTAHQMLPQRFCKSGGRADLVFLPINEISKKVIIIQLKLLPQGKTPKQILDVGLKQIFFSNYLTILEDQKNKFYLRSRLMYEKIQNQQYILRAMVAYQKSHRSQNNDQTISIEIEYDEIQLSKKEKDNCYIFFSNKQIQEVIQCNFKSSIEQLAQCATFKCLIQKVKQKQNHQQIIQKINTNKQQQICDNLIISNETVKFLLI